METRVFEFDIPGGGKVQMEGTTVPTEAEIRQAIVAARKGGKEFIPLPMDVPDKRSGGNIALGAMGSAAGAVLEPVATVASSMVGEGIAGLAGLYRGAMSFLDPRKKETAADAVRSTKEALTWTPRTEGGKATLASLASMLEPVGRAVQKAETTLGDKGAEIAGPIGGAIGTTLPTAALEALGLGAGRAVKMARGANDVPLVNETGIPGPEISVSLKNTGATIADLPPGAVDVLKNTTTATRPEEALRAARFEAAGVTPMRSNLTQRFSDQSREQRLLQTNAPESEGVRDAVLRQSQDFEASTRAQAAAAGVPAEAGDAVKEALTARKKAMTKEKRRLYQQYAETSDDVANVPIAPDEIRASLLNDAELDDLAITAGKEPIERLDQLLVKYGIDTDPAKVRQWERGNTRGKPNTVTPLTVGSFERFRKALNALVRADNTGAVSVAANPIIRALDGEIDLVYKSLQEAGVDASKIQAVRDARAMHGQIKVEFDEKGLTGKLTTFKKNSTLPTIEASKAASQVLTAAPEEFDRVVSSLLKSGDSGARALGNLQGKVMLDALEATLKAPTRKVGDKQVMAASQFDKYLKEKVGDDKLKSLFAGNPEAKRSLDNLREVAKLMTPPSATVPKGSAPVLLDALRLIGGVSTIGASEIALYVGGKAAARQSARLAMRRNPRMRSAIDDFKANWPTIAAVLGVPGLTGDDSNASQ